MGISRGLSSVRSPSDFKRFSCNLVSYNYDSPGKHPNVHSAYVYCSEKSMEMPTSTAYYDITVLSKVSLPNLPNKLPLSFIAPSYIRSVWKNITHNVPRSFHDLMDGKKTQVWQTIALNNPIRCCFFHQSCRQTIWHKDLRSTV